MDLRVKLVINLMQDNLHRELSPDDLAAAVGLSPSRLHYLFKVETGTSPARYLRSLRLERARALLGTVHGSVKQVMVAVGVNDRSHFEREFKRFYGLTPSKYRKTDVAARPAEGAAARVREAATLQENPPHFFSC